MAALAAIADNDATFQVEIETAFNWIGFNAANTTAILAELAADNLMDFLGLSASDIKEMASSFGKREAAGRIIFGLRRTKNLTSIMHWVQDRDRCERAASLFGIADAGTFRADYLEVANQRAELRKQDKDQADTISKAADPGKFKDERKWPEWEPSFVNYLSTIPGAYGIPLSYVVRDNDDPDHVTNFGDDFTAESIAGARLSGAIFKNDARKVHQLLKNFLVSETGEQWISPLERHSDGRRDIIALRLHYSGEGNSSRRITSAEHMRETIHYKSERSMSFSTFLDRIQKMYNIFERRARLILSPPRSGTS